MLIDWDRRSLESRPSFSHALPHTFIKVRRFNIRFDGGGDDFTAQALTHKIDIYFLDDTDDTHVHFVAKFLFMS